MSTLCIPLCKCPGSAVYEDLFDYMWQGYIMLPCPKCHGVPAAPGPSSSSATSERHRISFIMNETDVPPLDPTAAVPSSLATTSALASSSSEAAPSRRGIKRSFASPYPGTSRIDLYEKPRADPPPKAPRPVKQPKQGKRKAEEVKKP